MHNNNIPKKNSLWLNSGFEALDKTVTKISSGLGLFYSIFFFLSFLILILNKNLHNIFISNNIIIFNSKKKCSCNNRRTQSPQKL